MQLICELENVVKNLSLNYYVRKWWGFEENVHVFTCNGHFIHKLLNAQNGYICCLGTWWEPCNGLKNFRQQNLFSFPSIIKIFLLAYFTFFI